jgi:hypothetical protein
LPGAAAPAPAPAPRSAARRRQRTFVDGFLPEKTPKTRDFTLAKPGKNVQEVVEIAWVSLCESFGGNETGPSLVETEIGIANRHAPFAVSLARASIRRPTSRSGTPPSRVSRHLAIAPRLDRIAALRVRAARHRSRRFAPHDGVPEQKAKSRRRA